MLRVRRFVLLQVLAFFVIAAAGILYVGAHFVGLPGFEHSYTVTVQLRQSGGIFSNADVDYQGYPVGRVGSLSLTAPKSCTSGCTGRFVYVSLKIHSTDPIPAKNTQAVVADLSAVGEQYVDLEPKVDTGPDLHSGSFIPAADTAVPTSDEALLINVNNLVKSVNLPDLEITIAQLGKAFTATGPVLHQLIAAGDNLTEAANAHLPSNVTLINDGRQVLATQEQVRGDLATFSQQLEQFSGQLVASDSDYRKLLPNGQSAATQLNDLLRANESDLPILLANLVTVNQITSVRVRNIKEIFVLYPGIINDSFLVAPGDGTAHFGLNADQGSQVCTQGYLPQTQPPERNGSGSDPSTQYGGPADLNADCTEGRSSDPRGARYAPRPAGDNTATHHDYAPLSNKEAPYGPPSTGESSTTSNDNNNAAVTPYDTTSGAFATPGGGTATLGSQGGESAVMGSQSWEYLLLGPLAP